VEEGKSSRIYCKISEMVVDDMDLMDDMDKKMVLFSVHMVHTFLRI